MAGESKLKTESSTVLFTLLARLLESARDGEPDMMSELGIPPELVGMLEELSPGQIINLTNRYFRGRSPLSIFKICPKSLQSLVHDELDRCSIRDRRVDEFIQLGASKNMLEKFFGLRGTNISTRKAVLQISRPETRSKKCSMEEKKAIFDAWQLTRSCGDEIDRYLLTAKITGQPIFKIEHHVAETLRIEATLRIRQKPATQIKERARA
ncbi:hypothetical protein DOK_11706 [gamma proteobacterium BDW918]|nr:hypothetical protein DOK_11706 [gamma proteobacterium BDW918]